MCVSKCTSTQSSLTDPPCPPAGRVPAERPAGRAPGREGHAAPLGQRQGRRAQLSQAAGPLPAELPRPGERPPQQGDGGSEGSAAAAGMD